MAGILAVPVIVLALAMTVLALTSPDSVGAAAVMVAVARRIGAVGLFVARDV